jgi:hypothetical protein
MSKTVKVRIPVAVDPKGRYYAWQTGFDDGTHCNKNADELLETSDYDTIGPGEVVHWITAELPLPESVEVEAIVESR